MIEKNIGSKNQHLHVNKSIYIDYILSNGHPLLMTQNSGSINWIQFKTHSNRVDFRLVKKKENESPIS